MAQIPTGNFGYSTSTPVQSQRVESRMVSNAADIARQEGEQSQRLMDAASQTMNKISQINKIEKEEAKQIKEMEAATDVMRYQTQLKQTRSELEKQYEAGELSWDAMDNAWQESKAKITKPTADGTDDIFRQRMNMTLEQHDLDADDAWANISGRARKGAMQAATISAVDEMYKANSGNPEMIEKYLNSPEYTKKLFMAFGEDAPLKKTQMIEQAYNNSLTEQVINAGDDIGALSAIKANLESDSMKAKIDPAKRLSIVSNISSTIEREREQSERRALTAQLKAESSAAHTVDKWAKHIEDGNTIPTTEIPGLVDVTKGTSMESAVAGLVQNQADIQKVLDAPPEARDKFMAGLQTQMQQEGSTPEQVDRYKRMEAAITKREQLEKDDPQYVYEMKTGEQELTVDWQGENLQLTLSERKMRADAMGNDVLLKPQEKRELVDQFNKGDSAQQMEILSQLQSKLEPDMYKAVVSEIGKDKEQATLSYTGILAGQGKKDEALRILKGAEIEKAGASGYVSKSEFAKGLSSNFYSAFTGNEVARENAIDMAYKRYLATGVAGEDGKSNTDPNVHAEAIAGKMPVVGRRATIMPPDMEEEDFKNKIQTEFYKASEQNGLIGEHADYEYTAVTDKVTGRLVYRVDIDGMPVGEKPIYLEVSR